MNEQSVVKHYKYLQIFSPCAEQPDDAGSVSIRGDHLSTPGVLPTEKQAVGSGCQHYLP